jgi:hypothetical protein
VVTAHRRKFVGSQVIQRQVDRAAPTVARLRRYIALVHHLGAADIRVVPALRPAVLRLLYPTQKALHGPLRAVPIPKEQAEAERSGLVPRPLESSAHGRSADNPICRIPIDRSAGEVVPGRVLGVPADAGYELVDEDEAIVHRLLPVKASDTSRSISSGNGRPAAAIILG